LIGELKKGEGPSPKCLMDVMKGYNNDTYNLFCHNRRQQDAHEALTWIIDIFTTQSKAYKNFMSSLLDFDLGKIIKCSVCAVERLPSDVCQGLVIQIPKDANSRSQFEFQTLLSDYFNRQEEMDKVKCDECGQSATGQPTLLTHPEIFIFTLARFKTVRDREGKVIKTNKLKNFIGLLYSFI
jgi:uncharacterized UBP type Zn finger protein